MKYVLVWFQNKQEVADDLRRLLFVWIMFLDNWRIQVTQTVVPLIWKVWAKNFRCEGELYMA